MLLVGYIAKMEKKNFLNKINGKFSECVCVCSISGQDKNYNENGLYGIPNGNGTNRNKIFAH